MVKKKSEPKATEGQENQEEKGQEEKGEDELTFQKILCEELHHMNDELANLDEEAKELAAVVQGVTDIIYTPVTNDANGKVIVPGEFKDPQTFRTKLDALYPHLGKALDYVVRLEKQRATMFQQDQEQSELPSERKESQPPSPVNVTVSSPQPPVSTPAEPQRLGFFALILERDKIKQQQKLIELQNSLQQPIVATTKIIDVVEFGRQLQPAFNKIKKWFIGTLAELRHYPNEHIYFVRHEELATYFGQTVGALITFVCARLEYRRTLIEGRKLGLIRSLARIAEAEEFAPKVQVSGTYSEKGYALGREGFTERR